MPGYIAIVQVTTEYHVPVKAKDDEAAYDKVQERVDNDTWKKYAVESEDVEPEVNVIETEEADPDVDDFERWIR